MPTLIYGLPEDISGKLRAQTTWNGVHCDTKKVRIKLLSNLGLGISGQNLLRSPLLPVKSEKANLRQAGYK